MNSPKFIKSCKKSKLAPTNEDNESHLDTTQNNSTIIIDKNIQKNTHLIHNIYGKSYFMMLDALSELQKKQYLFGYDKIKFNGEVGKLFINKTYQEIFNMICNPPIKNLYEYYGKEDKVKLFIDLDCKICENNNYTFNYITKKAIESTNNKLKDYGIENPKYIILSANTESKLSAHIIYPEIIFENIYLMKDFFSLVDCPELKDNKIFDLSVYKAGNLRIYGASKIDKNNKLKLYSTNNYKYVDEYTFFLDTLLKHTNNIKQLNYEPSQVIIKHKNKRIIDKVNNKNKLDECFDIPLEDIEKYLDLISIERAKKYDSWLLVGMTLNNCNSDALNLWMDWSKKVTEYKDTPDSIYINKWNEFKIYNNGINNLKYMAKEDNPEKFREINYSIEKDNFESIEFNKEYLFMENDSKKDILRTNLGKFINDKSIKTLCIKSPYNTGKSTLLRNIFSDKYERILFVTYRKTLTNNIHGSFNGFYSYLDKKYKADKLICQVDSLDNLLSAYVNEYSDEYPAYDLIILDECESTLNHFNASILKNPYETFEILKNIIRNSGKLICLDGDLSNRTYDFIKDFGNSIILRNIVKKDKKHFIFRKNKNKFDELIKHDLEKGLNLCIVSMSSKIAESIFNMYKDKYKCCIHTGNGDDADLEKLKDVNSYWKNYQMILYSPTVESGVDFNVEGHINKIYGILSTKSTSQRAFMQMLARCRKVKDNKINILLNDLPYYENACYYTFNEARDYVISLYHKYLKKEHVIEDNKMKIRYVYDDYVNNLVYNKQEELNKNTALFVP